MIVKELATMDRGMGHPCGTHAAIVYVATHTQLALPSHRGKPGARVVL
jgi:hypothetical protein